MRANIKLLKKQKHYSEEFKKELVSLFEKGKYSVLQLERLYLVSDVTIYNWIYKYSTINEKGVRIVEMKSSYSQKLKELEQHIKELEQVVGQKQIKVEYLEKMIDIANAEFNIDIKKNFNTPPSVGSDKTKKR
jgi:transposase